MSSFFMNTAQTSVSVENINDAGTYLKKIGNGVSDVRSNLRGVLPEEHRIVIDQSLNIVVNRVEELSSHTTAAAQVLEASRQLYIDADRKVSGNDTKMQVTAQRSESKMAGLDTSIAGIFRQEYDYKDFIKSFGNIGKTASYVISATTAKSWKDWAKIALGTGTTTANIIKDAKNYCKIGRAVGSKSAAKWFLKKEFGFRNVGYASKCKKITSRFYNNLHNTKSPYNLKDTFAPLTGKKGVASAVAAWAGVALTGVINGVDNYQEYKNSGGKMSSTRAVAETITETAIDTVVTYGATAVVGAAITAVTGAVAAPVVVAVATGIGLASINALVKSRTGKSSTELISDGILDLGEAAIKKGKSVVTGAKKAVKSVAGWFKRKKLVFA